MAEITKKALAASLKKLLAEKPLGKITVTDIAEECGVNRQTFYYHFSDIYDLIEWIYTSEATRVLDGKKSYSTWQQGFLQIFMYALANKTFVTNTYHSLSREHLERYLLGETYQLLIGVVEELAAGIPVREDDKKFIADFYKYGFVGLTMEWIGKGMKEKPEEIVKRLGTMLDGTFAESLEKFRAD